jgi:hypothetical protein
MSLGSSRLIIGESLETFIQGIINPNTEQPLYQLAQLGAIFDPGTSTTFAEILHHQGQSGHAGSGGSQIGWRVDDVITYTIITGVGPYETGSRAAMVNMLTAQDVLLPALHQHYTLPMVDDSGNAVQSMYSLELAPADRSLPPVRFPNGHTYLLHNTFVLIRQQYNVELVNP